MEVFNKPDTPWSVLEKMRQKNFIPVDQYDLAGKLLANYRSILEAAEKNGIDSNNIIGCAKKGRLTAGAYVWRYAGDNYGGSYARLPRFQKVIMYSLKGKRLKQFSNATEAANETGVSRFNILFALKGETKSAGNFIWRFADNPYKGEYGNVQPKGRSCWNGRSKRKNNKKVPFTYSCFETNRYQRRRNLGPVE